MYEASFRDMKMSIQHSKSYDVPSPTVARTKDLSQTKDKMKVQQRMIDLTARELQSTRLSSQTMSSVNGNSTLEENILLLEVLILLSCNVLIGYK